jgi:aminoglycoside phosphotransferase (APT) family kinase protein
MAQAMHFGQDSNGRKREMSLTQPQIPADILDAVAVLHPRARRAVVRALPGGWDCQGFALDERLVVKIPRSPEAAARLSQELSLLSALKGKVSLSIPEPIALPVQPMAVVYVMIPGEPLLPGEYLQLDLAAQNHLAEILAQFMNELHSADLSAPPVGAWPTPQDILARVIPDLPRHLHQAANALVDEVLALPPDIEVFGHFDLHGWNMAFDHQSGRLNGVFDFGDAGRGPLHRDYVYPSLTAPDLAGRIAALRPVETQRVWLLAGLHRLMEAGDPIFTAEQRAANLRSAADWLSNPWKPD